jgi:hypothetical protein
MKKGTMVVVTLIMIMTLVSAICFAEEKSEENSVSSTIAVWNETYSPSKGENKNFQRMFGFFNYKPLGIGGAIEVRINEKNNYTELKPYLTFNRGSWYFLGGYSTDTEGLRFIQTGAWYINKFGDWNLTLDMRTYISVDGKKNDYTENLFRISHPIAGKLFGGLDLVYDHWWSESSRNFYMIRPFIGYKITKTLSVVSRYSREWDMGGEINKRADRLRLELCFSF